MYPRSVQSLASANINLQWYGRQINVAQIRYGSEMERCRLFFPISSIQVGSVICNCMWQVGTGQVPEPKPQAIWSHSLSHSWDDHCRKKLV
jgi:hypothetical protein